MDIIQEWDRTTMTRESVVGGELPVQGIDVDVKIKEAKLIINYNNNSVTENVIKLLSNSLKDWKRIIEII